MYDREYYRKNKSRILTRNSINKRSLGKKCIDCRIVLENRTSGTRCFKCHHAYRSRHNKRKPIYCMDCSTVLQRDACYKGLKRCVPCYYKSKKYLVLRNCLGCGKTLRRNAHLDNQICCRKCSGGHRFQISLAKTKPCRVCGKKRGWSAVYKPHRHYCQICSANMVYYLYPVKGYKLNELRPDIIKALENFVRAKQLRKELNGIQSN